MLGTAQCLGGVTVHIDEGSNKNLEFYTDLDKQNFKNFLTHQV